MDIQGQKVLFALPYDVQAVLMPAESGSRSLDAGGAERGRGTSRLEDGSVDQSQKRESKDFVRGGKEVHQIFARIVLCNLHPSSLAKELDFGHTSGPGTYVSVLGGLLQDLETVDEDFSARLSDMLGLANSLWTVEKFIDVPLATSSFGP